MSVFETAPLGTTTALKRVKKERDALAALMEEAIEEFVCIGNFDSEYNLIAPDMRERLKDLNTTLARRDLIKQSEALDVAAAVITGGMLTGEKAVSYLERVADELRQQAAQLENN